MSLNEWNPMADHYRSPDNSYNTGAGAKMPDELQPGKYKKRSDALFTLYISNIGKLDEECLRNIFSRFGCIKSFKIDTGPTRFWALLSYETQEAANNAITEMNDDPDYQFKVEYRKTGDRNYKPVPPSLMRTEAPPPYTPVRNQMNSYHNNSSPSQWSVNVPNMEKSLPSFQFSSRLFPDSGDQAITISKSGSMQSLISNAEIERKPVRGCAHCKKATYERCLGCKAYFCGPECMILGYKCHTADEHCIQLPRHTSEFKDLSVRSNGYDKAAISSPRKDIGRFDKENGNDQVDNFTEDTKNYRANCPQKPHVPRTISNNYDDEAGSGVVSTTSSCNSFGDRDVQVNRNVRGRPDEFTKRLPADASSSNCYEDNLVYSDEKTRYPQTDYQDKASGNASFRGYGSTNRGVQRRDSMSRSDPKSYTSRNNKDASIPSLPKQKESWDDDANQDTSKQRDRADDHPNVQDERRNQNNTRVLRQGIENDEPRNTTEFGEASIGFTRISDYKKSYENRKKTDGSRYQNNNKDFEDRSNKVGRKGCGEVAIDRSVYSTSRLVYERNSKYKVCIREVERQKSHWSVRFVEEESLFQQFQADLAAEESLPQPEIIKLNTCIVCRSDDRVRGLILNVSPLTILLKDMGQVMHDVDLKQVRGCPPKYLSVPGFTYKLEFVDGTPYELLLKYKQANEVFEVITKDKDKHLWKVALVKPSSSAFEGKLEKARERRDFNSDKVKQNDNSRPVDSMSSTADTRPDKSSRPVNNRSSNVDTRLDRSPGPVDNRSINQENNSRPVDNRSSNVDTRRSDRSPRPIDNRSISQECSSRSVQDKPRNVDTGPDESRPNNKSNDAVVIQTKNSASPFSFSLKENIPIEVAVTYISEGSRFYVGDANETILMIKEILKYEPDSLPAVKVLDNVSDCLAFYEGTWNRAKVVCTDPLKVYYLDFGNVEEIEIHQLKQAPKELFKINPLAVGVQLDSADGTLAQCRIVENESVKILPIKRGDSEEPWIVSIRQTLKVYPTFHEEGPTYFVIEESKNRFLLEIASLPKTPLRSAVQIRSLYFTYYDKCGCRVLVTNMSPLTVSYIDYGNEDILEQELYDLPDEWKEIPAMAFRITLDTDPDEILPPDKLLTISKKLTSETWGLLPNAVPASCSMDGHVEANVSRISSDDSEPATVTCDWTTMVEVAEQLVPISTDSSGKEADDDSDFELEDRDSSDEGIFSAYEEEFGKFKSIVKMPRLAHVIDEIQNNSVAKFIRERKNSIYGMLINDQAKRRINAMKRDIMKLDANPSYRPKKGELIASRIGRFGYRAIVLHEPTLLEPRYKLLAIDYGSVLEADDVVPLPERFKEVPFSSVKCIIKSLQEGSEGEKIVEDDHETYRCEIQFCDANKGYCSGVMRSMIAENGACYRVKFKKYEPLFDEFGLEFVPLKTGDRVRISSFNTANDCFITPANDDFEEDLLDMTDAVNMYAEKNPPLKRDPVIGEIVAVNHRGTYCRGHVLEYKGKDQFQVDLVDRGRKKSVRRSELKALPAYLKVRPRATVAVKLDGVRISEKNRMVEEFLLKKHLFELVIVDGDPVKVQLKFLKDRVYSLKEGAAATVNEYFDHLLTPYWLIQLRKNEVFTPRTTMYHASQTEEWIAGSIMPLYVADYLGEGYISVLDKNAPSQKTIIEMNLKGRLQEYCKYFTDNFVPSENEICLAKAKNGNWERAIRLDNLPGSKIHVHFLDTGLLEYVWNTEIRRIEVEFVKYHFAAKLVNVINYKNGLDLKKLIGHTVSCKIIDDVDDFYDVEIEGLEERIRSIDESV